MCANININIISLASHYFAVPQPQPKQMYGERPNVELFTLVCTSLWRRLMKQKMNMRLAARDVYLLQSFLYDFSFHFKSLSVDDAAAPASYHFIHDPFSSIVTLN